MIRRQPPQQQRVDGDVKANLRDHPEFLEPWQAAVNDCIYLEDKTVYVDEGELRLPTSSQFIPTQVIHLDVTDCDFVPRDFYGSKHGIRWNAIQDYDCGDGERPGTIRRYIATYWVQQV